jgi:DNA-binding response OmpR family regulator
MKVLVIDDNKSITNSLEKYLTIKGFDVRICNNGLDGFELIQKDQWDVILLDLSMPEYSGLDIIENLEKDNVLKDKNIILFTASSVSDYVLEKLVKKDGIRTCLKKPISLAKIAETITA